jgi:hypothetical protein
MLFFVSFKEKKTLTVTTKPNAVQVFILNVLQCSGNNIHINYAIMQHEIGTKMLAILVISLISAGIATIIQRGRIFSSECSLHVTVMSISKFCI